MHVRYHYHPRAVGDWTIVSEQIRLRIFKPIFLNYPFFVSMLDGFAIFLNTQKLSSETKWRCYSRAHSSAQAKLSTSPTAGKRTPTNVKPNKSHGDKFTSLSTDPKRSSDLKKPPLSRESAENQHAQAAAACRLTKSESCTNPPDGKRTLEKLLFALRASVDFSFELPARGPESHRERGVGGVFEENYSGGDGRRADVAVAAQPYQHHSFAASQFGSQPQSARLRCQRPGHTVRYDRNGGRCTQTNKNGT